MALTFDKALGIHQHTVGIRAQRAEVLSSNIANADTPHYKARDVDFAASLREAKGRQSGLGMTQSHDKHFDLQALTQQHVKYRVPNQPDTGDGNTVDVQQEKTAFMENALEYQMSLGMLDRKFSGLKKALKGN